MLNPECSMLDYPLTLAASPEDADQRLDQYLALKLPEVSRSRLQQLIAKGEVLVNQTAAKASLRLKGDERITVTGPPHAPPLRAIAEEIALDIVYEDDDLAIVNKPAGMMVQCPAPSFWKTLRRRRRPASRNRASPRSRHQRPDGGGQER
jgi:23S rRNA pseudouridine1911/1915/1917 synthase